ncbi:MAG: hypothetical protein AAF984_05260 [Verrucomicrobiota bacterium]
MAKPNQQLIEKLREAAERIESGCDYNWGNVGRCNCGHLAQCISSLSSAEIYQRANFQILEEWTEYAQGYCPQSGAPMDLIIDTMLEIGLELSDISHLEYLSDVKILQALPGGFRHLRRGQRPDVAIYMRTWAGLLEGKLKDLEHKSRPRLKQPLKSAKRTTASKPTLALA